MTSESFGIPPVSSDQVKIRAVASGGHQVTADHVFEIPTKLIKNPVDMKIWEISEAYYEYLGFILAINEAVKGKSNSRGSEKLSEKIIKLGEILDKLDARVDETPPVQQPQRFGNVAFRTWYQKMKDESLVLIQEVVTKDLCRAVPEMACYLVESFGNQTRIDYGTGHELSFIMFLCCLYKVGLLKDSDKTATGCYIFPKYLDLARKLQKTYRMEPAGSHGVWSLDDYQFVPFIWGSSQLFAHPTVEPSMFMNQQVLNDYGEDYMFLSCIKYINEVKTGPFAEHSNQLWSISGVSSWSKINGGLIKMYKAEVLSKFPVVQHIVFGSLFTLKAMEQCTKMLAPKISVMEPPITPDSSSSSSTRASSRRDSQSTTLSSQQSSASSVPAEERGSPDGSADSEEAPRSFGVRKDSRESGEQGMSIEIASIGTGTREPSDGSADGIEEVRSDGSGSNQESVRFSTDVESEKGGKIRTTFKVGRK